MTENNIFENKNALVLYNKVKDLVSKNYTAPNSTGFINVSFPTRQDQVQVGQLNYFITLSVKEFKKYKTDSKN